MTLRDAFDACDARGGEITLRIGAPLRARQPLSLGTLQMLDHIERCRTTAHCGHLHVCDRRGRLARPSPLANGLSHRDTVTMREIVPGHIWVKEHPVRFAGCHFLTRMTLLSLDRGGVLIHSPIPIDDTTKAQVLARGEVRAIVAPSTFHHLFVADAQRAFPSAVTYGVSELLAKRPDLRLQPLTGDLWEGQLDQVTVGNRIMREVVMHHRASRTAVSVDLVENFRDETPGTDRALRVWMKLCGMWNKPRPAPELRWLTRDRVVARKALEQILSWEFDRLVVAHGELLEQDPKSAIRDAWRFVLR